MTAISIKNYYIKNVGTLGDFDETEIRLSRFNCASYG